MGGKLCSLATRSCPMPTFNDFYFLFTMYFPFMLVCVCVIASETKLLCVFFFFFAGNLWALLVPGMCCQLFFIVFIRSLLGEGKVCL